MDHQAPIMSSSASSEDEDSQDESLQEKKKKQKQKSAPFRLFDLPAELRRKVYQMHLQVDRVIDLDPMNIRRIAPLLRILYTCKQIYEEAWPIFYGENEFRLFPTNGQFFHTTWIFLRRIPPKYRKAIRTLELRLGPGWTKPPRGWTNGPRSKLKDLVSLRRLNVFIELDPSDAIFKGFRKDAMFYTEFCTRLLDGILEQVSSVQRIDFNGYPSVQVDGQIVKALLYIALSHEKRISFGMFDRDKPVSVPLLDKVLRNLPLDANYDESRLPISAASVGIVAA